MNLVLFVGGLICLVLGAEALVRGASRLAATMGISPLVIGLTVVAFGTSAPELAVCIEAALAGQGDIALGNVVGSNIFNVLFILGLSALIVPLVVAQQLVRLDVPLMILVSAAFLLLGLDGRIGRLDGLLLFTGLVVYTVFLMRMSRRESRAVQEEYAEAFKAPPPAGAAATALQIGLVAGGLALLVLGAGWLVQAAASLARLLGVSELVIGLTIIAAGTSLPELVTSILAAVRGERDIAVGNVVGSNLFNILGVLGLTAVVAPSGVAIAPAALRFDLPIMIAVAVACLPIFFTGGRISRWEGGLLFGYYALYTGYLVLVATRHEGAALVRAATLYFVIPLTVVTLVVTTWFLARRKRE